MTVLFGYLLLNIIIGWVTLEAARNDVKPPKWIKVLIYISIIWAFSIHTVTGFLYAGIPGRHYWLTAIMAARFLASAFCSGPAILLLLLMAVRRVTGFEPGPRSHEDPVHHHHLCDVRERVLLPAGNLHGFLQRHPRTPALHPVPLHGS